jgi:hypothetical protein
VAAVQNRHIVLFGHLVVLTHYNPLRRNI